MNQRLKISIARGGCRFATPLYLGSSYVLSFEGERSNEAKNVLFIKPRSITPDDIDGIECLAASNIVNGSIELSLNKSVLVNWFKENGACDVNSTVDAHCYVFNEQGDCLADSPVTIEYSPKLFVIDNEDYLLARELLSQAISAKNQAISAKDSAISAKDAAEVARDKAQSARDEAKNFKTNAEEASSAAMESASISFDARDDAVAAKNAAQDAKRATEENATTVKTALDRMIASANKVVGGVEVLLWNGQGSKPVPIFIPNGVDGVTGYVMCDEDGKYYRLKCKKVDGEKVLALEQVGVDSVVQAGYIRAVNGLTPDETGNVALESVAKLAEARTITLSGDATGSVLFDGSKNVTILVTVDALKKLLPLAGGTITGEIVKSGSSRVIRRDTNSGSLQIVGGTDDKESACLKLYGNKYENESLIGTFALYASNGTSVIKLLGNPDGTLTWNNKRVTLTGDCLPLTGGIMTGGIKTDNVEFAISSVDDNKTVRISGGTGWDNGGSFVIRGQNHPSFPGEFVCRAVNGDKKVSLLGKPDGTLTWNDKHVLRVVEYWSSGKSWYRKYSDGWIEQGGCIQVPDGNNSYTKYRTLTLHTPFSNTNYSVIGSTYGESDSNAQHADNSFAVSAFTKTSCKLFWDDQSSGVYWYACGI